jgi:hypothetical protein
MNHELPTHQTTNPTKQQHRTEEVTGDQQDIKRLTKQVMNKCLTRRLISKQEAVTLLAQMPLYACTEKIENVTISNTARLKLSKMDNEDTTMINKYSKRPSHLENMSLYDFFHYQVNDNDKTKRDAKIPHFIGVSGRPVYPPTIPYAKHTLIVHKPWRTYPTSNDWITDFYRFMNGTECPVSARMTYNRVIARHLTNMEYYDPIATECDHSTNPIDMDDQKLLELLGLHKKDRLDFDDTIMKQLHRGRDYPWDKLPKVRQT